MKHLNSVCLLAAIEFLAVHPDAMAQMSESYCAFEVIVKTSAGAPVSEASVLERTQDGKTFDSTTTNRDGVALLCDTPPELVDIQVGGNRCGAVTVRYLRPYWLQTRKVSLTYDDCSGEDHMPPTGCLVTIRVLDPDKLPVQGVDVAGCNEQLRVQRQTNRSDAFGRIFRFLSFGSTLRCSLVKTGFEPSHFEAECKRGEAYQKQQVVVLKRPNTSQHE